jgi:hypothetical protein
VRTTLFLLAGALLLAAALILGKLFSAHYPNATIAATIAFIGAWLVISGVNMWVGVAKAGYSMGEELPIFLLIFGLPALAAALLKWKVL